MITTLIFDGERYMSKMEFTLTPAEKKPRKYREGSKYDPIIDAFLEGDEDLVEVKVEGKAANYLRAQLMKRIEVRDLKEKVKVSVVKDIAYMEKTE